MEEAPSPVAVPQDDPEVIVKLVLERSKKIFPTDCTFILAVPVGVLGMVTASEPSLAVARNQNGWKMSARHRYSQ